MNNPFTLTFGKEPKSLINRYEQFEIIKNNFLSKNPSNSNYLITGVRGSGKTVLLTSIENYFNDIDDWIVIDLNPEVDMIELLASYIYEKSKNKFKFTKKEFSFSFSGIKVSIKGEKPISNIITLLEKMFDVIKKNKKQILICIDEVSNNTNMKQFIQQFQIFIRKGYPLFLIMTGLYENVKSIQNEKSLTFLYRTPQIMINNLSLIDIAKTYEKKLKITYTEAVKISKLTKGYAFAYQVLGYLLFENKKKIIDNNLINQFDNYLREYVYEKIFFDLPDTEKEFIIAVATYKDMKLTDIANIVNFKKSNISQYRDRLIKKGIITNISWGKIDFTLPRFREYVLLQKEFI